MKRRLSMLLAASALVASTGCDGIFGVDLPGGSAKGETYEVTVVFDDVLDLVPQAAVKVDDVSVGDVEKIELDHGRFKANVLLRLNKGVSLPRNARARLRQTSLLGEKFVELGHPSDEPPVGELADGDVISSERSEQTPEVEEVFSALSALLNGGGIGNLQTIAVELSAALSGRENTVKSALRNVTELVSALDARKTDIVRAIDSLDRLTRTLAAQTKTIADSIDTFTPALTVLADQREELTRLLTHLSRLGTVGTRVVRASSQATLDSLRLLAPILDRVVAARGDLSKALDQVLLLTKLVPRAIPGDYLQLYVEVFLGGHTPVVPTGSKAAAPAKGASPARLAPTRPAAVQPGLPELPALPAGGGGIDWLVRQGVTS